ncbi:hypothetical protein KFK09_017365 [Dendrobium nobile]|uniref:Uncharacterized protein n=1 Tax=Dendrobium nobile TaxID=94219 RepID=A0A8T3B0T4_DENNO|nr:hypothetical protein KFK09_017365 [Dendrobium nobile]
MLYFWVPGSRCYVLCNIVGKVSQLVLFHGSHYHPNTLLWFVVRLCLLLRTAIFWLCFSSRNYIPFFPCYHVVVFHVLVSWPLFFTSAAAALSYRSSKIWRY